VGLLAACTGEPAAGLFELPGASTDFYALPFPNDLRREADGTIDLSAFPTNSLLADEYRKAADALDGFGLNGPIYTRFDRAIDSPDLPDPAGSVLANASVYLVDVDPDSPKRGERTPITGRFREEPTNTLGPNHIVARPYPGFPLREGTTYALVITERVGGVKRAITFNDLMGKGGDARLVEARAVYQPLLDWLDEPGGDDRGDVVSAAVFTTQRVTQIVPALRKAVFAAPQPVATDITVYVDMTMDPPPPPNPDFTTFVGNYIAPNFQTGDAPYSNAPTGQILVEGDTAVVQRMEPMRFGLTVPTGPVPPTGFPVTIYAHGTGGDHLSFVEDGTAAALAAQGIAVISTDQVLHGPRNPGGEPEIAFFNVANPYAMRDNALQGTADAFSQLRLVEKLRFQDAGRTIKLDATRVSFFGHSQGGLTGPGFVAFEPTLTGAVLSGTGGLLYLGLLYKTEPLDVAGLVSTVLRDDPVDEDNPTLALAQMWLDRADGANYAPLMVREPPPGNAPKNIFQTEGFTDSFTPNQSIEAFATALGGDLIELPDTQPIEGLTLRGRDVKAAPFSDNVDGVTAVLGQYTQAFRSDGHFVVFDVATARRQAASFLGSLAATGTATVVP
jgi:hypothetical protein